MLFSPSLKRGLKKAAAIYEGVFLAPYRRTLYRDYAQEEDLFMLICFSEMLGLPNPILYDTLELYPYFIKRFHQWHRRMGMDRSPLDEISCC